MIIIGGYYSTDFPTELETVITKKFNISESTYSLMYSGYSLPNMVLPLFGGVIMDKYGTGKFMILLAGI